MSGVGAQAAAPHCRRCSERLSLSLFQDTRQQHLLAFTDWAIDRMLDEMDGAPSEFSSPAHLAGRSEPLSPSLASLTVLLAPSFSQPTAESWLH